MPGLSRKRREAYIDELFAREQESHDDDKHERFVDLLRRTTAP